MRLYPITGYTAKGHTGIPYNRRAFEIARRLLASQIVGRGHVLLQDFPGRADARRNTRERKFFLVRGEAFNNSL